MSYGHNPPPGQPYGQPYGAPQPYGQPPQPGFPPGGPPPQHQPGPGQPPPGYGPQDSFRPPVPPPPGPTVPVFRKPALPVSSTHEIPGATVGKLIGDVLGVAIRPKGPPNPALATHSRQDAVAAMVQMADEAGADAVVGWRFETADLGPVIEVVAYGTAVTLRPARAIAAEEDTDDVLMVDDADEHLSVAPDSPLSPSVPVTQLATSDEPAGVDEHPTETSLEVTAPFTPPGMSPSASVPDPVPPAEESAWPVPAEPASTTSPSVPSWSDEAAPSWSTESDEPSPWAPPVPAAAEPAPAPRPEPGTWPFQSAEQSAPYGQQSSEPYGQQPEPPYGQQSAPPYGQEPQPLYGPPDTHEGNR